MSSCVLRIWKSRGRVDNKKSTGITFHRFRIDPERRKLWIEFVNRPNWEPSAYSTLCSKHFIEQYFDRTTVLCSSKDDAIPTINGYQYDLSASQFSPDGRVFQVEYAIKAVENSGTVIGLRGKDGVVLAAEKLILSKLHEAGTNRRIFNIDPHIGMAVSGLIADARQIVDIARKEASNYRMQYGVSIPLRYLNDRVSMYMHAYTLYSAVRPYGCSIILASHDEDGPSMYTVDPSGVSFGFHGCAIGKAKQTAKTEIEKLKLTNMTCRELVKEAAKIIYLVHDELKDKNFELELSWVCEESGGRHVRVPDAVFTEAERAAKQAMEADSDSDTEEM